MLGHLCHPALPITPVSFQVPTAAANIPEMTVSTVAASILGRSRLNRLALVELALNMIHMAIMSVMGLPVRLMVLLVELLLLVEVLLVVLEEPVVEAAPVLLAAGAVQGDAGQALMGLLTVFMT